MIEKEWWKSRTIIAIFVSIAAKFLAVIGVEVDEPAVADLSLLAVSFASDAVALWGRSKADAPIRWVGRTNDQ